jgi:hypothetical protein
MGSYRVHGGSFLPFLPSLLSTVGIATAARTGKDAVCLTTAAPMANSAVCNARRAQVTITFVKTLRL